jgi:hypothetical protein
MKELLTEWNWTFIGWNPPENCDLGKNRECRFNDFAQDPMQ